MSLLPDPDDARRAVDLLAGAPAPSVVYGESGRAVLVFGHTEADRARGAAAVRTAGLRVLAELPLADAVARLDMQARTGGVFVEVDGDPLATGDARALEALLSRLNADAAAARYASVVSTPVALLDLVAGLTPHARIQQLVDADDAGRVTAIGLATVSAPASFHDSASDADSARLRRLTDEVGRIASALAKLSGEAATSDGSMPRVGLAPLPSAEPIDAEEIRAVIRARRMRNIYFDAELFADPAWDMLLDLMAAHVDQQRVAVSSLCIAAAVPATTALRWIKTLTDVGLFVRRADPTDGRRVFIALGDGAAKGMRGYFAAVKRMAGVSTNLAQVAV